MPSQRRLYALAGAMAVETAELLKTLHRLVGPPGESADVPPRRRGLVAAAVRTYGALGACSALTARLLLLERDAACQRLGELPGPHLPVVGVTVLEETDRASWRGTVRAVAAALAELADARDAWRATAEDGETAVTSLETLMRYVDDVATVLESAEPPGQVG
jgi:hypothetical protein